MPSFSFMDMDGNTKEIDISKLKSAKDVATEFKKFREETKKGKKVYISTEEDKLKSVKVYEPKTQAELDAEADLESHLNKKAGIYQEETN